MGKEGRTSEDQQYPTWNTMKKMGVLQLALQLNF
jgi:hypothetical protein